MNCGDLLPMFGTTYQSHLQGSSIEEGCLKTLVTVYHYLLYCSLEDHSSHLHHGGSLKSRCVISV
jgi:hypothetical protein